MDSECTAGPLTFRSHVEWNGHGPATISLTITELRLTMLEYESMDADAQERYRGIVRFVDTSEVPYMLEADTPDDDDGGPWGVYEERCQLCGNKITIVATVESVENGTAEAYQGPMICMTCRNLPGPN